MAPVPEGMIKTRSIVLHRYPYSDSSWIVKALTEECGIVSFIVKGGKRKESPFKGALDPLALAEVVFKHNPNAELQFIKETSVLRWHENLRGDLLKLAKAQVMAEMLLRYAPQGVPLEEEFTLMADTLQEMDSPDAPENIFSRWLLSTSEAWGYHLDLGVCGRCGKDLTEPAADFSPESGTFLCKECLGVATPRAKEETLAGFWALYKGLPLQNAQYTENALISYLRNHIGFLKEINSLQWLQETRKLCLPQKT